jgi:hypothetical protein
MMLTATDRWVITELVTRADAMATRRDAEGYAALFTDGAVLDGTEGVHQGREQLRADVGPIWASEGDVSIHLTLNVEVYEIEGRDDSATASSVLVILAEKGATTIRSVSLIEQNVVRVGESWRISRRTVHPVTRATNS